YSDYHVDITVAGSTADDIESENNFGVFLGLDAVLTNQFKITIEGRFIDETAVSGGLHYFF
ncbi:MAG: hypothetical protein AB1772_13475, partial [Candidatus Zixiibacteriota bacterium]